MFEEKNQTDSRGEPPDETVGSGHPTPRIIPAPPRPGRSHTEDLAYLETIRNGLAQLFPGGTAAEQYETMERLERIKGTACGAQVVAASMMEKGLVEIRVESGTHENNPAYGIGVQAGQARRESPAKGRAFMAYCARMIADLPLTFAALLAGDINETQAMIIDKESAHLLAADRQQLDADLLRSPGALEGMGERMLTDQVRRLAYTYDSADALTRLEEAKTCRYAAAFPARDGMMKLSGSLSIEDGLAVQKALDEEAARLKAAGDPRTLAQLRADILVDRVTGRTVTEETKIMLHLVMTDRTLFQGDSEPAHLVGYGTVPASWARIVIAGREPADMEHYRGMVSLKRIYTHPDTGALTAMDSRSRQFPQALRQMINIRDRYCRTPYCNAPIKEFDHVVQHSRGGETSALNGAGRCRACNATKEQAGWDERVQDTGGRHTIVITTPVGATFTSIAPPMPGTPL